MPFVGPPAAGKRTIGRLLSDLTGAVLVDNHLINDPIFTAYDDSTFPPEVFELTARVRDAVLDTVRIAPPERSYLFTNYLTSQDGAKLRALRTLAHDRHARFVPVWLSCEPTVLQQRVTAPDRRDARKMDDPARLAQLLEDNGTLDAPPDALRLDTAAVSAAANARRIAHLVTS